MKRTDERLELHYITTPVTLFGRLPIGGVALRLHAGVSNNYLLSGAISDGQDLTGQLNRYEFNVVGGLGLDTKLSSSTVVTTDLRYERGLTSVRDSEDRPSYIRSVDRGWNNTIYAFIGFLF